MEGVKVDGGGGSEYLSAKQTRSRLRGQVIELNEELKNSSKLLDKAGRFVCFLNMFS